MAEPGEKKFLRGWDDRTLIWLCNYFLVVYRYLWPGLLRFAVCSIPLRYRSFLGKMLVCYLKCGNDNLTCFPLLAICQCLAV